jgi:hypothetical protein
MRIAPGYTPPGSTEVLYGLQAIEDYNLKNPNDGNGTWTTTDYFTLGNEQTPTESMARNLPNAPQWLSDTGPSWNPETGLDIYGNYGGPIGTSGPMGGWGSNPRIDAQNIANGWTQPSTGQTQPMLPEPTGIPGGIPAPLNYGSGSSYNPLSIGAGGVGATGAGLFGTGLFGGQLQNYMMQPAMNTASLYDALMGFRGGLFGQQLQPNSMMRMAYPGSNTNLGYPMQRPISQPMQQQFNQQQPAFFDSLAYRPL